MRPDRAIGIAIQGPSYRCRAGSQMASPWWWAARAEWERALAASQTPRAPLGTGSAESLRLDGRLAPPRATWPRCPRRCTLDIRILRACPSSAVVSAALVRAPRTARCCRAPSRRRVRGTSRWWAAGSRMPGSAPPAPVRARPLAAPPGLRWPPALPPDLTTPRVSDATYSSLWMSLACYGVIVHSQPRC